MFAASPTPDPKRGFTLIELLVVVSIIGVLMGIVLPVLGKARECAVMAGELSAARQLVTAHTAYTNDHAGMVMPGFCSDGMLNEGAVLCIDDKGRTLTGLAAKRYPWRLLPYLDYNLGGLYRDAAKIRSFLDTPDYAYAVSTAPRLGLNQAFVGGSADSDGTGYAFLDNPEDEAYVASKWGAGWYVSRIASVANTSELIVFASAHGSSPISGTALDGMYRVTPPYFTQRLWQVDRPNRDTPPGSTGSVSFRFAGRAVASMVDGHAQTLDWDQMQDMQRWAPRARTPEWMLPPL